MVGFSLWVAAGAVKRFVIMSENGEQFAPRLFSMWV